MYSFRMEKNSYKNFKIKQKSILQLEKDRVII